MQVNSRSSWSGVVALMALGAVFGCSSSTSPSGIVYTHPSGVVDSVFPLTGRPFGVGVSTSGVVLVGRQDNDDVVRASIADFRFSAFITAGDDPGTIAMAPNGATALVSNFNDFNVGVINVASNTQTTTEPVVTSPYYVIYLPSGSTFYVGTGSSGVKVFNASALTLTTTINAGDAINGMAFNADASKFYVTSGGSHTVSEIDVANNTIIRPITMGGHPKEVAISLDSTEMWVADEVDGVEIYTMPSGAYSATVPGTVGAWGLRLTPDGTQLYATLPTTGAIKIISRTGRSVLSTIPATTPRRIAFDQTGAHAVIADEVLGAILIK